MRPPWRPPIASRRLSARCRRQRAVHRSDMARHRAIDAAARPSRPRAEVRASVSCGCPCPLSLEGMTVTVIPWPAPMLLPPPHRAPYGPRRCPSADVHDPAPPPPAPAPSGPRVAHLHPRLSQKVLPPFDRPRGRNAPGVSPVRLFQILT